MKRFSLLGVLSVLVLLAGCQQTHVSMAGESKAGATVGAGSAGMVAGEIIVDDKDAGFKSTGTWNSATAGKDYKDEVMWAVGSSTETATATWTPDIKVAGMYAVYEWHGNNPANDHASNEPFTIKYDGGEKTVAVDLQSNIGKWNLLGTFKFAAGTSGTITVTNKANGNVLADAIRLVLQK